MVGFNAQVQGARQGVISNLGFDLRHRLASAMSIQLKRLPALERFNQLGVASKVFFRADNLQ